MGAVLACLVTASHSVKKSRDDKKKKTAAQTSTQETQGTNQNEPQPLTSTPPQHDVQQGLQHEHLASVPPPVVEGAAIGTGEVARSVATEAPVPVPVPTATNNGGKMASDEDYAAFLEKANQDPNEGVSKTQGSGSGKLEFKATEKGVEVPKCIVDVVGGEGAWYTSDADEKFEAVALKYTGKTLPTEEIFAKTISHPEPKKAKVEIMDIGEWDSQGEYQDVVNAVREAGKGSDVRVYQVKKDSTRSEYWVVTIEGGKLVGAKVLAVES